MASSFAGPRLAFVLMPGYSRYPVSEYGDHTQAAMSKDDSGTVRYELQDFSVDFHKEFFRGITVLAPTQQWMTLGEILHMCYMEIASFLETFPVTAFKVGITTDPNIRFDAYKKDGFTKMVVIMGTAVLSVVEEAETSMIAEFSQTTGCLNERSGGDGGLARRFPNWPYYFV